MIVRTWQSLHHGINVQTVTRFPYTIYLYIKRKGQEPWKPCVLKDLGWLPFSENRVKYLFSAYGAPGNGCDYIMCFLVLASTKPVSPFWRNSPRIFPPLLLCSFAHYIFIHNQGTGFSFPVPCLCIKYFVCLMPVVFVPEVPCILSRHNPARISGRYRISAG